MRCDPKPMARRSPCTIACRRPHRQLRVCAAADFYLCTLTSITPRPWNAQVCAYRCIVSYESALLQDFSLCILQKHNCLDKDVRLPVAGSGHRALLVLIYPLCITLPLLHLVAAALHAGATALQGSASSSGQVMSKRP